MVLIWPESLPRALSSRRNDDRNAGMGCGAAGCRVWGRHRKRAEIIRNKDRCRFPGRSAEDREIERQINLDVLLVEELDVDRVRGLAASYRGGSPRTAT